jgi:DNA mismatch endonuclease (patch repair protein)
MDIKSPEERSRNMAKIKNANTKPEMHIRSLLHRQGFRFRVNYKGLPGKPDIYFSGKKVAVFIHGCYWHRHEGCKYAYTPKTNVEFWTAKLERNREHDREVIEQLNELGIRVLTIWECAIAANGRNDLELVKSVEGFIEGDALSDEV